VFAVDEMTVHVPFEVAWARLNHLIIRGALDGPSEAAYRGGLASEPRADGAGDAPGGAALARVRVLEPVHHDGAVTIGLRWEAAGPRSEAFPVLDADLALGSDGAGRSRLGLAGSYRPLPQWAGAAPGQAALHCAAATTFRSLLEAVADGITHPDEPRTGAVRGHGR
jgi:hypothetical protein